MIRQLESETANEIEDSVTPAKVKPQRPAYSLEIEFDGGCEDSQSFMALSFITTEGNSLEELINNAVIGRVDQDGGDHGHVEIECMSKDEYESAVEAIKESFAKEYEAAQ